MQMYIVCLVLDLNTSTVRGLFKIIWEIQILIQY